MLLDVLEGHCDAALPSDCFWQICKRLCLGLVFGMGKGEVIPSVADQAT